MGTSDILGLLGGLALFLYGMKMMSDGLEGAAGEKLEYILEKLTDHKVKAVIVGALVTCVIQSSSAMTVMLIGFVNAKLMKLDRAIWVVMGANIGTTITGQIIALNVGAIAPLFAILGVAMILFFKKKQVNNIGEIIGGFGILFMGLEFMALAMEPLQTSTVFIDFMTTLSNPIIAILFGAVFTAVIQSSSASMGILQTLAAKGLIGFHSAAYVVFGLNIGTCITAFLASLTGCRNSKRLTLFHVMFNIFGTMVFFGICTMTPLLNMIASWSPDLPMSQLANLHTIFNIGTTMVVLFIDSYMLKLIYKILPIKE